MHIYNTITTRSTDMSVKITKEKDITTFHEKDDNMMIQQGHLIPPFWHVQ